MAKIIVVLLLIAILGFFYIELLKFQEVNGIIYFQVVQRPYRPSVPPQTKKVPQVKIVSLLKINLVKKVTRFKKVNLAVQFLLHLMLQQF